MSDLLTPVMVVMEGDEVDTFWTFNGLMDSIVRSFSVDYSSKFNYIQYYELDYRLDS